MFGLTTHRYRNLYQRLQLATQKSRHLSHFYAADRFTVAADRGQCSHTGKTGL
jgi:hypothetical protein